MQATKKTNRQTSRPLPRILSVLLAAAMSLCALVGCGAAKDSGAPNEGGMDDLLYGSFYNAGAAEQNGDAESGETDPGFVENPFVETAKQDTSTFSADVDTASYALFRKTVTSWVNQKANVQTVLSALEKSASSFRTEEFLNYFRYEANVPSDGELFGTTAGIIPCPWNAQSRLLRLTLQAPSTTPSGGNNLVFLIDVSGSMSSDDKLPLLKTAFSYLAEQPTAADRVSVVTYSGKEEVILEGCPGNETARILEAVNGLSAHGATNGEDGLRKAYRLAADYRIEGGNNRIIMASDGDLNVGISSETELKTFVEGKRDEGIFLSVLGFGSGNYRDRNMEALADNGNGVYYYIDGVSEAQKVFGTDLISTLYTVAKDVKLQLTFDPTYVEKYRQIGYENRQLAKEDFTDDTKDAGEVGAGHQVTVFYELILTDAATGESASETAKWMELAVRYKEPNGDVSQENTYTLGASEQRNANEDEAFMLCVIELTMLLHDSEHLPEGTTYRTVRDALRTLDLTANTARSEFRELVEKLVE